MGKIHSVETMGLVDGPGIRFVIFFQGCHLRCAYCHNPDTWSLSEGQEISAQDLINKALRYKTYFKKSGGGITCSGGEPLLQPDFLLEVFKLAKEAGIHTALDTAGFGLGSYKKILHYTDLVILDIKHYSRAGYKELTGGKIEELFKFQKAVEASNKRLWLRHVVVPGITDSKEHMKNLKSLINTFKNIEKVELLPYHALAIEKYQELGINYKLAGLEGMDKKTLEELEDFLLTG